MSVGYWVIPLLITIVAFVRAEIITRAATAGSSNFMGGNAILALFNHGAALIISLVAWLVWAVLT